MLAGMLIVVALTLQPTSRSWELTQDNGFREIAPADPRNTLPEGRPGVILTPRRTTTQPLSDALLIQAQSEYDARRYKAARKSMLQYFAIHGSGEEYDQALFLMARVMVALDQRIRGYYYCDQLMDQYPSSYFYAQALQLQYTIADEFLDGRKLRTTLGLRFGTAYEEGIEMLFRIQSRSPGSPLAERALLRTAEYYYNRQEYDLSATVYGEYARRYSRSPYAQQAALLEAYSNLNQYRTPLYDVTPLIEARTQMTRIAAENPQLAQDQGLQELIDECERGMARKLELTADYYRRVKRPGASIALLERLAKLYPNTPEGQAAREKLGVREQETAS